MNQNEIKAQRERDVLYRFVKNYYRHPEEMVFVESKEPPYPDCYCRFFDGKQVYFELSEIVDEGIAKKGYGTGTDFSEDTFLYRILTDRIRDKITKQYRSDGLDVHLLLYFNIQPHWKDETMIEQVAGFIFKLGKGIYRHIWLYFIPGDKVIGPF